MATLGPDSLYIFNKVENEDLNDLQDIAEVIEARHDTSKQDASTQQDGTPPALVQRNIHLDPIDPDAVPLASSAVLSEELLKQVEITETISTDGTRSLDLTIQDNVISSTITIEPGTDASAITVQENIIDGVTSVDLTIEKSLADAAITVESGSTASIAGDKKVKNSEVEAVVEAGETVAISFDTRNVKGSTIRVKGEGAGDVSFEGDTRVKGTKIKFKADSADSVSFADGTLVKNVKVKMGGGDDTITFGDVKLAGKNVVKLGDGNDTLEISSDTKIKNNGRIVVKDFEEGDTVKIHGESFTGAEIASNDLPAFLVIRGLS